MCHDRNTVTRESRDTIKVGMYMPSAGLTQPHMYYRLLYVRGSGLALSTGEIADGMCGAGLASTP